MTRRKEVNVYKIRRINYLKRFWLLAKFYCYYNVKTKYAKYSTVARLLLSGETRLYYLWSTKELVEITWRNYIELVKVDAKEFALIKRTSKNGESWMKGERF